ncbi:MAG: DUF2207 domain-containing protein [Methanolinea sp.]|nr:DUF2207 domain-containing protein [Methanolinea sp.]
MALTGERKDLLILVAVAFAIGAVAIVIALAVPVLFEGDLVIADYRAALHENGTFEEVYTYEVRSGGTFRMLYRYWQDPLSAEPLQYPFIQFVGMENPPGTVGYIRDASGKVTLYRDQNPAYARFIEGMAERNEVGIYNPGYFPAGTYTVSYTYILHPPIEYDASDAHLNLRLVDRHIPFRHLGIRIPSRYAAEVFPHPPGLSVSREGEWVSITGQVARDEVLGVETLFSPLSMAGLPGFPAPVDGVRAKTLAANPFYNILPLYFAWVLYGLGFIMVVLTPLVLVLLYRKYGTEREFTVPEYLSFTPDPTMKPWAVNLLFKGDPMTFDQDGYFATLLDLHRKKMITIQEKPDGKGVRITVNQETSTDPYEQRILDFLQEIGEGGTVDSEALQSTVARARRDPSAEKMILKYQRDLLAVTRKSDPRLVARYVVDGRDHIFPLLFVAIALCAVSVMALLVTPVLSSLLGPAVILFGGMVVQSGIALAFPSTLFGHWKDDRYREKLQWDAFARFLSDLALLRQYAPADISMWGEWLVYGTALGVGDRVEKAMKELNVSLPEAGVPIASGLNAAFIPVLAFTPPSRGGGGGGFGGGSFGGGGGFGGGGVGGR